MKDLAVKEKKRKQSEDEEKDENSYGDDYGDEDNLSGGLDLAYGEEDNSGEIEVNEEEADGN